MVLAVLSNLTLMAYDWKGKWISTERSQSQTNEWLAYRKTVEIK